MLEAIGILTIVGGLIIALHKYAEYQGHKSRDTELIREKYSKIIHLRTQAILQEKQLENQSDWLSELEHYPDRNPKVVKLWKETNEEINRILNDPNERTTALKEIEEKKESWEKFEYEQLQQMKESRKLAFKYGYDEMIFRIFNSQDEIIRDEFIEGVMNNRKIDKEEAIRVTQKCLSLQLISDFISESKLSIGYVLTSEEFKLTDSDLTIYEWRKQFRSA